MANKHLHVGPGGRRCICCFPAPGSRDRRAQYRISKRKADRAAMYEAYNEIAEHEEMLAEEVAKQYEDAYGDGDDFLMWSLEQEEEAHQRFHEEELERDYYARMDIEYGSYEEYY